MISGLGMARGVHKGSRKHVFKQAGGVGLGVDWVLLYEMKLYGWGFEMQIKESEMGVCICFVL